MRHPPEYRASSRTTHGARDRQARERPLCGVRCVAAALGSRLEGQVED